MKAKSGRKRLKEIDKKIPVSTYHKLCDIKVIGIENARDIAHAAIENKIKKAK